MNTNAGQQPVANECADNTYNEIADESESGTPHDLSGQPAGNKTNHQYDQKTFVGNVHVTASATCRPSFAE
jgi:hypothetical protein